MGHKGVSDARTYYAPAERAEHEAVARAHRSFIRSRREFALLDALPVMTLALNAQRQTVHASRAFLEFLGNPPISALLGKRPGEILGCVHADEGPGGCGTSRFCRYCGAAEAILQGLAGESSVEECRLLRFEAGKREALDLRVWAAPASLDGEPITLFTVLDIRDEKRRHVLERLFFHDVLNTADGIRSIADMLCDEEIDGREQRELSEMLASASGQLVAEIEAQRFVGLAESGELTTDFQTVDASALLSDLARTYGQRVVADDKTILTRLPAEAPVLRTDPTLLGRVLANLLKNALEASGPGDSVVAAVHGDLGGVTYKVSNPAVMTEEVRRQVFKRSFSTKGQGRGLGTWSVKLLTERYLGGEVTFTSEAGEGTTFRLWLPARPDATE